MGLSSKTGALLLMVGVSAGIVIPFLVLQTNWIHSTATSQRFLASVSVARAAVSEAVVNMALGGGGGPKPQAVLCHRFSPGRLGNHLFELASTMGIANSTNRTTFFTNTQVLKGILAHPVDNTSAEVTATMTARCKKSKKKGEKAGCKYDRDMLNLPPGVDVEVFEYMQSWVYFDSIKDEIRRAVAFSAPIVQNASRAVAALRAQYPNTTLVGVHNRRGDLLKKSFTSQGYTTAGPEFFKKAFTYFRERFPKVLFVVFGEDRKWNMENLKGDKNDVIFPELSSPAVDMEILSRTDHIIRTVGTYGWWAAFKKEGRPTVVYLKEYVKRGSSISKWYSANGEDYMLPGWIGM